MVYCFSPSAVFDISNYRISLSGGYQGISPTWDEYLSAAPGAVRPVFQEFKSIVESSDLYRACAMTLDAEREGGLDFEVEVNGTKWSLGFSFRAWGDFMAAVTEICEVMGYTHYY